jgi:type I restriction enzyme S subunit
MKDAYVETGVPFLRSQNVRANRFRFEGLAQISRKFHKKIIKSVLYPGDVVVVRSGNVGAACTIPEELGEANCSDLVVIQRTQCVNSHFLCFYLNSLASVHVEAGSVAGLTQEDLAYRAEVSVRFISFLETGKRQPSLSALAAVSKGLGQPITALVMETERRIGVDMQPTGDDTRADHTT